VTRATSSDCCSALGIPCDPEDPKCSKFVSQDWTANRSFGSHSGKKTGSTPTLRSSLGYLALSWGGTSRERRSLHFFCNFSILELAGYLDWKLWKTLVTQISVDLLIKHAIAAIGACHEFQLLLRSGQCGAETKRLHVFSTRQCNQAMTAMLQSTGNQNADLKRALTASVLFTTYENLNGCRERAQTHTHYSKALLEQLQRTPREGAKARDPHVTVPLELLRPLVAHYEIQGDYYIHEANSHLCPADVSRVFPFDDALRLESIADCRTTLERAIATLGIALLDSCGPEGHHRDTPIANIKNEFSSWFRRWGREVDDLHIRESESLDEDLQISFQLLRAHQLAASTMAEVDSSRGEAAWGDFTTRFQDILALIEPGLSISSNRGLSFAAPNVQYVSQTMGLFEPLYCVAARCVDTCVAQKAVTLIEKLPLREGGRSAWKTDFIERILSSCTGKPWPTPPHKGTISPNTFNLGMKPSTVGLHKTNA
jgi:hypothetical protein